MLLPKIVIIEQPELHLHPALQARVGDLFCALIKLSEESAIKLRLIIETHSETIINRVGGNVAKGIINSHQVGIAVFHRNLDNGVTTQEEATFGKKGELINWPYGFFEAPSANDS